MKTSLVYVAGVALFAAVASKIGWGLLVEQLEAVWVAVPLLVVLGFCRLCLQTSAWAWALRAEGIDTSIRRLMGMRLASQGIGYLTPLGAAVSEPMKIKLLGGSTANAASGTLVDTCTYWFASAIAGIIACLGAAMLAGLSRSVTVMLVVLGVAFVIGLVLMTRSKPLLPALVRKLGARSPQWLCRGAEIEDRIRTFASRHPHEIRQMFWLDVVCQLILAAEVAAVLWTLRIPVEAGTILALEAANRGVKMVTGWMPGRIGADETASAGTFAALGLSSASGIALALARRMRDLLACLIGLAWLIWTTKFKTQQERELTPCRQLS